MMGGVDMTGRTKRKLLSLAAGWILLGLLLPSAAGAVSLSPSDETVLARTLAEECPEVPYAARVGMAAAVLGRMGSPEHPDSLRDVLAELEREGAFGSPEAERSRASVPGPSSLFGVRRILSRLGDFIRGRREKGPRLYELSLHAVRAAEAGADPMDGALSFRVVRPSRTPDFLFNDAGEDAESRRIGDELREYPLIVGGVGFR